MKNAFEYLKNQLPSTQKMTKKHQRWYLPNTDIWGKRYMKEADVLLNDKRSDKEANIIQKIVHNKKLKILDIPCGYGRLSNRLAKKGFNVVGVDINKNFIKIAEQDAKNKKLKIKYLVKDVFSYNSRDKYDVVINIFTSIGYFESEEKNLLFIKKLSNFVKPNGLFILETINPLAVIRHYNDRDQINFPDGSKFYYEHYYDYKTAISVEKKKDVYAEGTINEGVSCVRLYYPHELIKIFHDLGYTNIETLNSAGNNTHMLDSFRMWLVFKKI